MSATHTEGLVRGIGVRQLTATIVNSTVGAGIFVIPALAAKELGGAAWIAYAICAVAMALIVTTFAMAGSRVSRTGGIFAYVEIAFGPYLGFVAGTFLWLSVVLGSAGVSIAFLDALAVAVPAFHERPVRLVALAVMLGALAGINVRGVRTGARTVEILTLAKLLPLVGFVAIGAFAVQPAALAWPGMPDSSSIGRAVLLLSFAFMGIEVALTPSGEVKSPSSTVPRAIYLALAITTALYVGIQFVAQGVLGAGLPAHTQAPLADATRVFLGGTAATVILAGTLISMLGFVSGDSLCSPRSLYAFGREGFIPAAFGRVHPVFRTPHVAIWAHAAIVFVAANSGTFETIAIVSNVAGFAVYLMGCCAALRLMSRDVRADGEPFTLPGGRLIAWLSVAAILAIMSTATIREFAATGITLAVASLLYVVRRRSRPAVPASA